MRFIDAQMKLERKRSESLKRYWAEKHKNEADELSNK